MTEHLLEARRADVAARTARVHAVLDAVAKHSEVPLTVVEIARRAEVHKSFIHRHPELKAALDATRAVRTQTIVGRLQASDLVTSASLKADLENEKATTRRLRSDLQASRTRLGELMGTAVAADIIGDGTTNWKVRAGELLEENRNLLEANRRVVEEVDAVRARNRDLTRRLNASRTICLGLSGGWACRSWARRVADGHLAGDGMSVSAEESRPGLPTWQAGSGASG